MQMSAAPAHIKEDRLWETGAAQNSAAMTGFAQVFSANIENPKHMESCLGGLSKLMLKDSPNSVYLEFEKSLSKKGVVKKVPTSLIELFIDKSSPKRFVEIDGVFNWLLVNVRKDPEKVLELLELLIEKLSNMEERPNFYKPIALVSTLNYLLQEADLTDDVNFINKVLSVQNWFLEQGVQELEEMLEH